jgi:hypothetical protein
VKLGAGWPQAPAGLRRLGAADDAAAARSALASGSGAIATGVFSLRTDAAVASRGVWH